METITSKVKGLLTLLALVSAIFAIDYRYAKAQDVKDKQAQIQQIVQDAVINIHKQNLEAISGIRKQTLEDKIFEIDVKPKLSSVDQALKERYKRQLRELK